MKFLSLFTAPFLWLSLLIGCTSSSDVSMPEIPSGSAANPQGPSGSRRLVTTNLREDAITRATSTRLDREGPATSEKSAAIDHSGMKMDRSSASPAVAVSYTCPMHPEIHRPTAGECPICGMKLVKEKTPAHAH